MAKLFSFACAAEHVHDFVTIEFLHIVTSRAEVLAGVEFGGLFSDEQQLSLQDGCRSRC